MKKVLLLLVSLLSLGTQAQQKNKYLELGVSIGPSTSSIVVGMHKNWTLGKKDKLILGTGARLTSFFGTDVNFITAPANLTSDPKNIDSLFAPKPSLTSINAIINIGYRVNKKIEVGFNIDAIGVSFGPKGSPTFVSNGRKTVVLAKPTSTNVLLVGDNDRGSLNSQFYGKVELTKKIGIKLAYQFLFNELTTTTKVQTVPSFNDRFRVKSSMGYMGLTFGL